MTYKPGLTIWVVAAAILCFLGWSWNAPLEEVVRGPGKIVPASQTQVVQSLDGGIITDLLVREGDVVKAGQVLARLDDTRHRSSFTELEEKAMALELRLLRLQAQLDGGAALDFPDRLRQAAADVALSEAQLFQAAVADFDAARIASERAVELKSNEVDLLLPMEEAGVIPTVDLLRAQQAANEETARLTALTSEYELEVTSDYATTLNELKQTRQTLAIRRDQLERTDVASPVDGLINKVSLTTIGGVVQPGQDIFEITPLDDELQVEVRIKPEDIAFVRPNMPASIKLSAYDYTVFGLLDGRVTHISADTFEDAGGRDGKTFYKVRVEVDHKPATHSNKEIEIRPGMLATVELRAGEKTVFAYLFSVFLKTGEAMREP